MLRPGSPYHTTTSLSAKFLLDWRNPITVHFFAVEIETEIFATHWAVLSGPRKV
jgi:hypothetical protein